MFAFSFFVAWYKQNLNPRLARCFTSRPTFAPCEEIVGVYVLFFAHIYCYWVCIVFRLHFIQYGYTDMVIVYGLYMSLVIYERRVLCVCVCVRERERDYSTTVFVVEDLLTSVFVVEGREV